MSMNQVLERPGTGSPADMSISPLSGELEPRFQSPAMIRALQELQQLVTAHDAKLLAGGRNRNVLITIEADGEPLEIVVKSFGRQPAWKDAVDHVRGSKARRSYLAAKQLADNGVGTPRPVGYVEHWQGKRLVESHFLTLYADETQSLTEVLVEKFRHDPECGKFIGLLDTVAELCRGMHDAGFMHRDLGNQNILTHQNDADEVDHAMVIDLNRGLRRPRPLSIRERAQDLSRLEMPSAFLEFFLTMYWDGQRPSGFTRWYRLYRSLFQLRARSRWLRHPIRETRKARAERDHPPADALPGARDLWVWDARTAQAFSPLTRKERLASYPSGRYLRMLTDVIRQALPVWRVYRRVRPEAFRRHVDLRQRFGLAIEPTPEKWQQKRTLLRAMPALPVLLRFYHHDSASHQEFLISVVEDLASDGHPVKVALVQDRNAVTRPEAWRTFVMRTVDAIAPHVQTIEVGHAINRVKWGIWDFSELRRLYDPIVELAQRWPDIEFVGPATIDFEYPFTLSALGEWPDALQGTALSHHLYVDRRGAPENPQSSFNSIEKFALARAISIASPKCNGQVYVSEVNWPIDGTGSFSPIASPDGNNGGPVGVDETTYAAYMLRYLLLGLGSGYVDRIYWWRLNAHGYGLIDDLDPGRWRKRPAWDVFLSCYTMLGESTFIGGVLPPQEGNRHGIYEMFFVRPDGEHVAVIWSHGEARPVPANIRYARMENMRGETMDDASLVDGSPVYLRGVDLVTGDSRQHIINATAFDLNA